MLDRLLDSDKEIENDYKNLSLWSKEAIEIKPTITSNLKLIMISLLLSTVVWFISSIFIVIKRNINQ